MRTSPVVVAALVFWAAIAASGCDDDGGAGGDGGADGAADSSDESSGDATGDPDLAGPDLHADAGDDPAPGDGGGDAGDDAAPDAEEDVPIDLADDADAPDLPAEDAADAEADPDATGDTAGDAVTDPLDDIAADLDAGDLASDAPGDGGGKDVASDPPSDGGTDAADTADGETGIVEDENEPNETAGEGTPVGVSYQASQLTIHSATDDDWFEVTVEDQTGLRIQLDFEHDDGDLDMAFYTQGMGLLGISQGTSDQELLVFGALVPGTYYLHVYGWEGAINAYDVTIAPFEAPEVDLLFSDLAVANLQNPRIIRTGGRELLGLVSYIPNYGTAPAPGSDFGNAYAAFRLRDPDTGEIVLEGVKGPIFLTNNGGCEGEAYSMWLAAGAPEVPGTGGAPTTTDPGCTDVYVQETNAFTVPLFDIESIPNGDYLYELDVNQDGGYAYEPSWALANNRGWVPITISGSGLGRTATQTGVIQRSGRVVIGSGVASTVLGGGGPLEALTNPIPPSADIGRPVGLAMDQEGRLLVALYDAGAVVREVGDGEWELVGGDLEGPWGVIELADGDLVVAESAANRLTRFDSDGTGGFSSSTEIPVDGLAAPTDLALDADGRLYVANSGAHEVLAINPDTGAGTAVAGTGVGGHNGDGTAAGVALSWPVGIAVSDNRLVFIADGHNNRLRVVNPVADEARFGLFEVPSGEVVTLVGNGATGVGANLASNTTTGFAGERRHGRTAIVDWPSALRVAGERIFFLDADNHRLRVFDEYGAVNVLMGDATLPGSNGPRTPGSAGIDVGDGGPGLQADLNRPRGLLVVTNEDGSYDIYIADTDNYRVRRLAGVTLE